MSRDLLTTKSKKKTSPNKSQTAFNRLIKKVERVQSKIKETEIALDESLRYYHLRVHPIEGKIVEKLSECIPLFYSYYSPPHAKLSVEEREILRELIQSLLSRLARYRMPQEINSEIKKIIEDIDGINFQETLDAEFNLLKEEVSRFAAKDGLNIDLSKISSTDSKEALFDKLRDAVLEAAENREGEGADIRGAKEKVKKKSKQQLQKEQKAKEVEEIQKRGLAKIYKQLAKAIHPDLELDSLIKAEKEALMKKLTTAYEKQDLYTLLSLEIEWMNREALSEDRPQDTEEQLKIYNALLKDQLESLQEELDNLFRHPRYFDMQHILEGYSQPDVFELLQDEEEELSFDIKRYSLAVADLRGGSNFQRIKQILREFSSPPEEIFSEFAKFFLQ